MSENRSFLEEGGIAKPEVLLIEACDFESFPAGGQLSFSRQLLKAFGNRFALVGISTGSTPVGRWVGKQIDGTRYDFFAVSKAEKNQTKRPLIPLRILHYLAVRKYTPAIMDSGIRNVFTQCSQVLLAIQDREWDSVCFCFPNVMNVVEHSRYRWARLAKRPYERALFKALRNVDLILAAADSSAIDAMVTRSKGRLKQSRVVPFPTRADTIEFFPQDKRVARSILGLDQDAKILLSCGKLMYIKGWRLLLEAVALARVDTPNLNIVFVGDGEDRNALKEMAGNLGILDRVQLVGLVPSKKVALFLNAADVFVVGSIQEGWSVAMVEAISCGLPIVSTNVSGANDLIRSGLNGYVLANRDPAGFAKAINSALGLQDATNHSLRIAADYSLEKLGRDLSSLWPAISN